MEIKEFNDKTAITDLLMGEKYLCYVYNTFLSECATPEMVQCLGELLTDAHNIEHHIFEEMNSRGWYSIPKAEDNKVQQAKQKFAQQLTV